MGVILWALGAERGKKTLLSEMFLYSSRFFSELRGDRITTAAARLHTPCFGPAGEGAFILIDRWSGHTPGTCSPLKSFFTSALTYLSFPLNSGWNNSQHFPSRFRSDVISDWEQKPHVGPLRDLLLCQLQLNMSKNVIFMACCNFCSYICSETPSFWAVIHLMCQIWCNSSSRAPFLFHVPSY